MSKAAVVGLFYVLRDNVHLVLFNACHSEPIAEALAEVIPCTIGMSGAITDDAAITFASAFYRGLGFGRNIQEAFDLGKNALMNLQVPEYQTPRLYSRKGAVDPAKVVLVGPSIAPSRRLAVLAAAPTVTAWRCWRRSERFGSPAFSEQSLFHETRILLGLSERPDAVARPMDLLVKRPHQGERPLPSGTQVVDVYDTMDQSLLILGAPGSGKTTLLLELARDLLARAAHDPAHPIPVVFPLSTWAESRKPSGEWLIDELNLRYDVPRKSPRSGSRRPSSAAARRTGRGQGRAPRRLRRSHQRLPPGARLATRGHQQPHGRLRGPRRAAPAPGRHRRPAPDAPSRWILPDRNRPRRGRRFARRSARTRRCGNCWIRR